MELNEESQQNKVSGFGGSCVTFFLSMNRELG